jgi:uncharacterized delta-60 repeat protein
MFPVPRALNHLNRKEAAMNSRNLTPNWIKRLPPFSRSLKTAALCALLLLLIGKDGRAQSPVDGFDPGTNGIVYAVAVQADGKILVGGSFSTIGGGGTGSTARNNLARLNSDGTVDASFNPGVSEDVYAIAVQGDGKIVIGGHFSTVGGGGIGNTARNRIARLNADGTVDVAFNPGANADIYALAVQPDGKIVVGGNFSTLGGGATLARSRIGRLNSDGGLDATFNPGANLAVYALALQADAKIVVGGSFSTLGGGGTGTTTRNGIGRLNANGSLDASFDPGTGDSVYALAIQPDGKIVVGGFFPTLGGGGTGTTARNNIGRLNANGSLDGSFNPGADDSINILVVQPDGKILVGGFFSTLGGVTRNKIGRLNPNATLDTTFDPGANNSVYAVAVQADDKVLVVGNFSTIGGGGTGTTSRNNVARLNRDATADSTFDPGANGAINALAVQPDGKVVVGGAFTTLGGGGTGVTTRNKIGRLNPNATIESSFDPGANNAVDTLAVQADGKILVGGDFTTIGGGGTGTITRNFIARLNPNGSVDAFNPGANNSVYAIAVQPDGKILVGGAFTTLGGGGTGTVGRNRIGRLNADGSIDLAFNPGTNAAVSTLLVQTDGKILVGGDFTTLGGGGTGTTTRNYIGRLNANGTIDPTFNPDANVSVNTAALQADGKIVLGGIFTALAGTTERRFIGRVNSDGSLDTGFNPGANSGVNALALQADGQILLGGFFGTLGGGGIGNTTRQRIGRLDSAGAVDPTFNPGANSSGMNALTIQGDGKIVAGGAFTMLGGGGTGTIARSKIGRLTNTDAALQQLTTDVNGTTITWTRSGASPEVDRVTFELSTDGNSYSALATPTRVSGGWQLTGQSLPIRQSIFIRARGFYSSGFGGSGSIVETVRNVFLSPPPLPTSVVSQKAHGANEFGIDLPLSGTLGVECRSGGESGFHEVIVTFAGPVTLASASITSGTGSVGNASVSGNQVTVDLISVANAQTIKITLFGLSDGTNTGNLSIPMGVLAGDTSGNGTVNASDVSLTKLKSGQAVDATNFRTDVTLSNSINASDVSFVKLRSGTALP